MKEVQLNYSELGFKKTKEKEVSYIRLNNVLYNGYSAERIVLRIDHKKSTIKKLKLKVKQNEKRR